MKRSQKSQALQQLSEAIGKAPGKQWNRRAMAATLNVSISQMTRLFRNHFGFSPKELVIRQRMMKATQLLANPERKIESIAEELGYSSLHAFTHIFTKHVGMPPSKYRARSFPSGAASR
jgi:AraC-like DNA-binding protein